MIRRLILCGLYTPEEAAAATLVSDKMADGKVAFRSSPAERRILLFQSDGISFFSTGRRRQHARIIDDPVAQALAVVNASVIKGEPIINVFTGLERDGVTYAYSDTDAVLTFGFPDGSGVAYFHRVAGGVAPGIAQQCLAFAHAARTSPWVIPIMAEWVILRDGVRFAFFKRKPYGWQRGRELAIGFVRGVLDRVLAEYGAG